MITRIASRQAFLDGELAQCNGGSRKFYSGARPAGLVATGTLLATCPASATCSGATNSSGVATHNAFTTDAAPTATGTIGYAMLCKADGTPVFNESVGLAGSGADVIVDNLNTTQTTGTVAVLSSTTTFPAGN